MVSLLRERRPDLGLTVSATTRAPREGEIDGTSYHFISEEEFQALVEQDAFLEWDGHFGARYGTLWSEVNEHLDKGCSVILEIDVNGALNVRRSLPEAVLIFIAPPSLAALEERLRGRGSEDEERIARRLERCAWEMEQSVLYDEVLVNDELDVALEALEQIISHYEIDDGGMVHNGHH